MAVAPDAGTRHGAGGDEVAGGDAGGGVTGDAPTRDGAGVDEVAEGAGGDGDGVALILRATSWNKDG